MIGPAHSQAQFKSSSSLQCLSCFNLSGKPPPLFYQPECQPATTKRKQKHARRGKMQKTSKTLHGHHRGHHHGHHSKWWPLVIIWSLFQNDVHGHHLMTMTVMAFGMVIIFKMTTMVVIFLITLCKEDNHAQKPDDDHGRHFQNDDHGCHTRTIMEESKTKMKWWPQRMMTMDDDHGQKICQPDQFAFKKQKMETKTYHQEIRANIRPLYSFPHFAVHRKRRLCTCLPEYLKRHWQASLLPYTDLEIRS